MSSADVSNESAAGAPPISTGEFKLEVVVLPVTDVDRAKRFYEGLGWRLDADVSPTEDYRIVQLTPPGSGCSIQFGIGVSSAAPGSVQSLYLAVADIGAAREELTARGADVSEVFHEGAPGARFRESDHAAGSSPDPYSSFATFSDPDGNGWLLQEITARLPGR
jgi:catechol 2,3-dioxygenase-like lactoylglutathione lyase family enzyme